MAATSGVYRWRHCVERVGLLKLASRRLRWRVRRPRLHRVLSRSGRQLVKGDARLRLRATRRRKAGAAHTRVHEGVAARGALEGLDVKDHTAVELIVAEGIDGRRRPVPQRARGAEVLEEVVPEGDVRPPRLVRC